MFDIVSGLTVGSELRNLLSRSRPSRARLVSGLERNIGIPTRWWHLPRAESSEIYELSG